jgi:hypothetical protein
MSNTCMKTEIFYRNMHAAIGKQYHLQECSGYHLENFNQVVDTLM